MSNCDCPGHSSHWSWADRAYMPMCRKRSEEQQPLVLGLLASISAGPGFEDYPWTSCTQGRGANVTNATMTQRAIFLANLDRAFLGIAFHCCWAETLNAAFGSNLDEGNQQIFGIQPCNFCLGMAWQTVSSNLFPPLHCPS